MVRMLRSMTLFSAGLSSVWSSVFSSSSRLCSITVHLRRSAAYAARFPGVASPPERHDDGSPTHHGLDHDETEGLGPVDRKQQGHRAIEKRGLFVIADLAVEDKRRRPEFRDGSRDVTPFREISRTRSPSLYA